MGTIERRLARARAAAPRTVEEYLADADAQDLVEHNLQLMIQACIDLGLHVLSDFPEPLPDTNREVFTALGRQGILTPELADSLAEMAGFRNVLVHFYAGIDRRKVYEHLAQLDDVRRYLLQMSRHLGLPG